MAHLSKVAEEFGRIKVVCERIADSKLEDLDLLELGVLSLKGWSFQDAIQCISRTRSVGNDDFLRLGPIVASWMSVQEIELPFLVAGLLEAHSNGRDKRINGSYYTDVRLAKHFMKSVRYESHENFVIVDLAVGSGILLAAAIQAIVKNAPISLDDIIATKVYCFDIEQEAVDSVILTLMAMASNLQAVVNAKERIVCGDGLSLSSKLLPSFDENCSVYVVGNPPWARLRTTKYEALKYEGKQVIYGDQSVEAPSDSSKKALNSKKTHNSESFEHQGLGDGDLFKYFCEVAHKLVRQSGQILMYLPASFIRNLGTMNLRRLYFGTASNIEIELHTDKFRYFGIDSRFKFILANFEFGGKPCVSYTFRNHTELEVNLGQEPVAISVPVEFLESFSTSFILPEMRDTSEFELLERIYGNHVNLLHPSWAHTYRREIDLTNHRPDFTSIYYEGLVPVLEGRMVSQFTTKFKSYVSGSGRAAKWAKNEDLQEEYKPQFWVSKEVAEKKLRRRLSYERAVFCDISGQTNERTMQSAVLSDEVICGNKTPTLEFDNSVKTWAWVGISNSFIFDWLLRRQVTNTLNYFILQNVALPFLDSPNLKKLSELSKKCAELLHLGKKSQYASKRADLDCLVANLYGLQYKDIRLILDDFNLLDRGQPSIFGESVSTVTKDLFLSRWEAQSAITKKISKGRLLEADAVGALAYCHN